MPDHLHLQIDRIRYAPTIIPNDCVLYNAPCRNEAFLQLRVAVRVLGVALNLIARFHSHIFFLFCEDPGRRAPLSTIVTVLNYFA